LAGPKDDDPQVRNASDLRFVARGDQHAAIEFERGGSYRVLAGLSLPLRLSRNWTPGYGLLF
jgi:hypothetical protein